MAHVNQSITLTPSIVQFGGLPTVENTFAPRARIQLFVNSDTVTAKGAADTKSLSISGVLPTDFAYVLDTVIVSLFDSTGGTVKNYNDLAFMAMTKPTVQANPRVFMQLESDGVTRHSATAAGDGKVWGLKPKTRFPEVFTAGDDAVTIAALFNDDDADATNALNLRCYWSFLQYDIRQAEMVAVNAPAPISVR